MRRVHPSQQPLPSILAAAAMPPRRRGIPYGWRLVGARFERDPVEWAIVEKILVLHWNRHLAPAICDELTAAGMRTRRGELFTPTHVYPIIKLYGGRRSAAGARPGQHRNPQYGWRRTGNGESIERHPEEWRVVEIILQLHRNGLLHTEIARHLTELGLKTRTQREFYSVLVSLIVKRNSKDAKKTPRKKAA